MKGSPGEGNPSSPTVSTAGIYETNKDGTPKRVRCADEILGKNCRIVKAAREYNDAALLELTSAVSTRYQPITLGTAINGSAVAYGYRGNRS